MKKMILLVTLALTSLSLLAQKPTFGIQAGLVLAKQKIQNQGITLTGDSRPGFAIGVTQDVPLSDKFIFQSALNYVQKGGDLNVSQNDGFDSYKLESSFALNYFEVPLNFLFTTSAGKGKFFAGAGPALSFGVGGNVKAKQTIIIGGETEVLEDSSPARFGSDGNFKTIEFSGNLLAGYELSNNIFFALNYSLGFNNITNNIDTEENGTIKNNYIGLKVGYKFARK